MPFRHRDAIAYAPSLWQSQIRVLTVLAKARKEGALLSRAILNKAVGYTPMSGTLNRAMNGIPANQNHGKAMYGLHQLGFVRKEELDIDGVSEVNYAITDAGLEALELWHKAGNKLKEVKDRETCINKRYGGSIQSMIEERESYLKLTGREQGPQSVYDSDDLDTLSDTDK